MLELTGWAIFYVKKEPKFRVLLCCMSCWLCLGEKKILPQAQELLWVQWKLPQAPERSICCAVGSPLGRLWAAGWQPSAASLGSHWGNVSWNGDSLSPQSPLPGTSHASLAAGYTQLCQWHLLWDVKTPEKAEICVLAPECRSVQPLPLLVCSAERPEPCPAPGIPELCLVTTGRVLTGTGGCTKTTIILAEH